VLTGIWIGLATPFAVYLARRQRLTPSGVYVFAVTSSILAAALFFVLFMYFSMFCLPVSFLVAAAAFHVIALRNGGGEALREHAAP